MDVWCNGQKLETTVRQTKECVCGGLSGAVCGGHSLILVVSMGGLGALCGGWGRDGVLSGGTRVLHQSREQRGEEERHRPPSAAGRTQGHSS